MPEGTSKGNIDLDELINLLLQEKAETSPQSEPEPQQEPVEPPLSVPGGLVDMQYEDPYAEEEEVLPEPSAPRVKKERKRRFGRRATEEKPQPEEEWADWGLDPIGHYQAVEEPTLTDIVPPAVETVPLTDELPEIVAEQPADPSPELDASQDEFPTVTAVAETITLPIPKITVDEEMQHTRVVSAMPVSEKPVPTDDATRVLSGQPDAQPPEQMPDQLSLEELVRVEDIEDAPAPQEDAEEAFRRAREERVRDFALSGDEEEEDEPEEEAEKEVEEEPEIEDFTTYEDAKAVQLELQYRVRSATIGVVFSAVLELATLFLALLTILLGGSPIHEIGYLTVQMFALILMCLLNYPTISRGISGLFSLRANADTAASLTLLAATAGVALHFINLEAPLPLWVPLAGLAMVFNTVGQLVQARRVRANFAFVGYNGDKYAAALIDEPKTLHEIGQRVVIDGDARIAYFKRTEFLSNYLQNAYTEHIGDTWSRWMAPLFVAIPLVVSGILALCRVTDGFWEWLQVFAFSLSLAATPVSLCVQCVLSQCSRYMLRRGGFMVGWQAVRTFGAPDAVTVSVEDLYPDESMLLHGIKTFSGMHIDDAILDAASLAIRSGGPLAQIFRRIIQDKTELLKEVENLVYEQGMGLSGWVDGRRVLVGNRNLLANHGVDVPSLDYEARYAKNGRRLVYLSTAGELSAMFVVSYLADDDIKQALQNLCRAKVTVLVRSCDPNVTAADLCSSFGLDDYYVEVLPAVAGRMYDRLMAESMSSAPAVLASNGHIIGISGALSACRSVRIRSIIGLVVSLLLSAVGVVCGAMWASYGVDLYLLPALLLSLGGALATLILPLFRRI